MIEQTRLKKLNIEAITIMRNNIIRFRYLLTGPLYNVTVVRTVAFERRRLIYREGFRLVAIVPLDRHTQTKAEVGIQVCGFDVEKRYPRMRMLNGRRVVSGKFRLLTFE